MLGTSALLGYSIKGVGRLFYIRLGFKLADTDPRNCRAASQDFDFHPKGRSTKIMSTLGFYIGNSYSAPGQVIVILDRWMYLKSWPNTCQIAKTG